jgi:RNA-directed DNA polymerase
MLEPGRCGGTSARQAGTSRQRGGPLQAPGVSYQAEDSAAGKACHTGKAMTEVRRPHRTLLPDTVGSAPQQPTSLQGRAHTAQIAKPHRCRDLYRCLDTELLLACGQDLTTQAASGVAGLIAHASAVNFQANISAVAQRLQGQRSRATRVRRGDRPQENGAERPRGMPTRDDQRGQLAGAQRLTAISAQDVRECRSGSCSGRGAVEAVRDRPVDVPYGTDGSLVEAAVTGVVAPLDPTRLWTRLRERSEDRALLRLLRKGLKAGVLETDGRGVHPETGAPPGGRPLTRPGAGVVA